MSEAFLKAVNMSISAGWLVLAVLALRLILRKAPNWVNVLLWGIVAVRLICPISIESAMSLIPSTETISPEIMLDLSPEITTGIPALNSAINPIITDSFVPNPGDSANPLQILIPVAANIWVCGILVLLLYTSVSYAFLRRKLRMATILRDNIYQCEAVDSPFVLGILKPIIYVPYEIEELNLNHVIAHEMAHIRRKDHWWKPLGFLLLTIYWFNPLMWAAYILLCRDIELACDEKVIAELGNQQRADYTKALVACSVNRRMIAACPLAFGEVGVKERVRSIMNYRKPSFWIIVTAMVLCVLVAMCFLTDPKPVPDFTANGDSSGDGAKMWFDYSDQPELLDWNSERKYTIEEYPGVIFQCSPYEITVGETVLIQGMPIWSVYLEDLNGDGYPEICAETSFGSGLIDQRIVIFDYANGVSYELEDRGFHDYFLQKNEDNGHLYVEKRMYDSETLVSSERLRIGDGQVQMQAESVMFLMARLLEIHDAYYLVEPIEGNWKPGGVQVPMRNMVPSPEPQVGDILQIEYWGIPQNTNSVWISNVRRISVAEQESVATMIPTETKLKGLGAGALLLPMDGHTYRYLLKDSTPEGVTADELLFTFQEIDMGENILNEVYSLKEYPGRSKVLLISAKNGPWLCEYSPPQRCSDTALTDAIEAGYVVMEDGIATHGQDIWHDFYEQTQKGKKATVTVAHYHTLDRSISNNYTYCEVFEQDYPCLYVHELSYDGKQFTLSNDAEETETYEYLMKYEDGPKYAFGSIVPQYRYQYVLTHENRYTYDQLWMSIASSQAGAAIDHYTIYSEPKL